MSSGSKSPLKKQDKGYELVDTSHGSNSEGADPFTSAPQEFISKMETNLTTGLTITESNHRLNVFGPNELEQPPPESLFSKIKEQFEDLLVRLLLLAAVVSFVISQFETHDEGGVPGWVEPLVIFTILVLNACVGIYQDYDAEKALDALKELQTEDALVLRDNVWSKIKARQLVPGDIVQITMGNKVPADMRLVHMKSLTFRVDESILTGETRPPIKVADAIVLPPHPTISEKKNAVFSGTLVIMGTAIGVVINTGMKTEIGKIHSALSDAKEDSDTPLKQRLNEFGDQLAKIILLICVVIWLMNFKKFSDPALGGFFKGMIYYFKVAVSLAVAAIPEGLPAVITTCLALGTRRMAKENCIVRKLPSVETLGCTTVICTDKTGTLTTNEMTVKYMVLFGDKTKDLVSFPVTGTTYAPEGEILGFKSDDLKSKNMKMFLDSMSINNESKLHKDMQKRVTCSGLPTEGALKTLVEKIGNYDHSKPDSRDIENYNKHLLKNYDVLATLEFDSNRKCMSMLCNDKRTSKNVIFIKGAPEYLIKTSKQALMRNGTTVPLDEDTREELSAYILGHASKGLRTLAIAYKEDCGELAGYTGPSHPGAKILSAPENYSKVEAGATLIGLVAMHDPPRPEVKEAIKKCKKAGITVIMITGDIKETAQAIGSELGIISEEQFQTRSYSGNEFEQMNPIVRQEILQSTIKEVGGLCISRSVPVHKMHLVQELRDNNQIVAMTGDGVNDAPALKKADIGVAMGVGGTWVAKEASDMILADDNFATIVTAVEEGRTIYSNMKGFIRYMISSNIGEVLSILLTSLLGIPDGFNSIQLLWVNLVTDGLPATALSFNPPSEDTMKRPPRNHEEPIVTRWVFIRYTVIGTYVGVATVGIFIYWYMFYQSPDGHTLVTFSQLTSWSECPNWEGFSVENFGGYDFSKNPCTYFTIGKAKASTLSLSVLVIIEMFNAINALSDDTSLLKTGIFINPILLLAIAISIALHCVILYIPFFQSVFSVVHLTAQDWFLVVAFSFPVFIIDEILKFITRRRHSKRRQKKKKCLNAQL
jgi:Ca2+-transporting ATPase